MLTSITPLGERGRNNRWWLTVTAHSLGSLIGGVLVGAAVGLAGVPVVALLGPTGVIVVLTVAVLAATAMDLRFLPIPGLHRQVNEDWMVQYRGWVYGAGFGFQLGTGFATIVTSGITWLAFALALLSGGWAPGAVILGAFGLVRGLIPWSTHAVRDRNGLMRFSARLISLGRPVERVVLAGYALVAVVVVMGALR